MFLNEPDKRSLRCFLKFKPIPELLDALFFAGRKDFPDCLPLQQGVLTRLRRKMADRSAPLSTASLGGGDAIDAAGDAH